MNFCVGTFQVHIRLLARFEFPARTPYKISLNLFLVKVAEDKKQQKMPLRFGKQ